MPSDFFSLHSLRIDPWAADYEPPIQLADGPAEGPIALDVEGTPWAAICPPDSTSLPNCMVVIDGRRRLDARMVGRLPNGGVFYGAFATVAAGAVALDLQARVATFLTPSIQRVLAFGAGVNTGPVDVPCPFGGKDLLAYDRCLIRPENEPDTPMNAVQEAMLKEEAHLARTLTAEAGTLVMRDGPLRHDDPRGPLLGYVKTMHQQYLPADRGELLWQLRAGERTPLFVIGKVGDRSRRWSWYMRSGQPGLSAPRLGYHGLHGLVRLELSHEVPLAHAVARADQSALLVPRFASESHRDPRAPQNLTPVGALEKDLGRRMGDPMVIHRRLTRYLARHEENRV